MPIKTSALKRSLLIAILCLGLAGCALPSKAISGSTSCSEWLGDSMSTREGFLHGFWINLSKTNTEKVIEIKDASCKAAEGDAEPGKSPTVGPFQPLVNEVIGGTYG
jgi:hypothetical protein